MSRKKLLFLQPSQKPVHRLKEKNLFYYMSEHFEGDAISCLINNAVQVSDQDLNEVNALLPNFTYHVRGRSRLPRLLGIISENAWILWKAFQLCRKNKYDAVVAHPVAITGLIALILKLFFGCKVIVNIPTHPVDFYTKAGKSMSKFNKLRLKLVNTIGPFIVKFSDVVKLMYPTQLDDVPKFKSRNSFAFHDFVPVTHVSQYQTTEMHKTILLVGSPMYLKGADVLIKAFNEVHQAYPDRLLVIVGKHTGEQRNKLLDLSDCPEQIKFYNYVPNDVAIKMMAECEIFVNASRTECIARVLQEAMALRKPIVASYVGGTPSIIRSGRTGITFFSEDVDDLANALLFLLNKPDVAKRLANNAYDVVMEEYSEKAYVDHFKDMVNLVT